jgi:hypothetical protein
MKTWWLFRIGKFVAMMILATLVLGFVVMALWNALIPDLFHGPQLTFWQAAGLLLLSHLLLRTWGFGRHGNGWRRERWRRRFEEKLASMNPEEREKFREEYRRRCGPPRKDDSAPSQQSALV